MRLKDYIRLGWDQLRRRKVVTALCALGIAIGCSSIIVALSFGESISHYSQQSMSQWFKMDEITISTGHVPDADDPSQSNPVFVTSALLKIIESFPDVQAAAPFRTMEYMPFNVDDTKSGYIELVATRLDSLPAYDIELRQGSTANTEDTVIIGYGATFDLYDERARELQVDMGRNEPTPISYPLYQKMIILKKNIQQADGTTRTVTYPLKVVGVVAPAEGTPVQQQRYQKQSYISLETANRIQEAFRDSSDQSSVVTDRFESARVKVTDQSKIEPVETLIKKLNLNTHNNLYQMERFNEEMIIVRFIFGGIGVFILLVASLTIVVAMTMATHQRRRQIGIMKVLGANLAQIRNMFIFEATLLGIMGGLLGILFSYWVIWGVNLFIIQFSGQGTASEVLFISGWVLPLGMLFAILTGVLSGLYPAIKASRTDALTAIKRE
jgi:ABC-type antimicrobial peptide transport system permease subunit